MPFCNCGTYACFNYPGNPKGLCCSKCKLNDMVDVTHKKCIMCGIKQPSFGLENENILKWCIDCKPNNSIDIKNKKCIVCNIKQPSFGFENENIRKWCVDCKPNNAIDISRIKCKQCNITIANPKCDKHCVRCFVHLFPDKPVSRNYKIKENHVFDAVIEKLPENIQYTRDKQIQGGCSKRRPDLMIDLASHWLCIEVDENFHKDYDTICENKRTMELYTDMANRPMVLIRFNCDKNSNEPSLFKICRKTGISIIRSKKDFNDRINVLMDTINKYIKEVPDKAI